MHTMQPQASAPMGLYQESIPEKISNYWLENPWTETLVAVVTFTILMLIAAVPAPLASIPADTRHGLYQVSVTASVTLLGLTMTSVSVLVSLIRAPLTAIARVLKPEGKARLGSVFLSCMWAMLAMLCASVIAFTHDGTSVNNTPVKWVELIYVVIAAVAALRLVRIAAVLRLLISVA